MSVQKVIDTRIKSLQRQIQNIKSLVTEPTGLFETLDKIIKTTRYANRETLAVLGIHAQGLGSTPLVGTKGPVVKRLRDLISNIISKLRR